MSRFTTTTAMPYAHLAGATSVLRAELNRQIAADGEYAGADWSTLRVIGPVEVFGPRGALEYEYRGSVEPRRLAPLPNRLARSR
ncbi:hypothetical protein JKP75_00990 [Blastococcus sp. TML/M2B]|uniref:hypothetical protein n=1 Tax=unclassified Blastococcus TaxID=2619396 RepID=UPI00190DBEE0|nr:MULTISPECIES: hypothetical protein [unclassified Blastococcus]MBN1091298.1 hypothetical protein [Blastococcus sp. TML/M2B]MBN1095145.1 hypothetical protein [Blastococcus sp. TML/C7B]